MSQEKPARSKSPAKRGGPAKAENGVPSPELITPDLEEQAVPDGVLVTKTINEDGILNVDVKTTGNVQVTEVQTLLELGVNTFRSRIGLSQKPS